MGGFEGRGFGKGVCVLSPLHKEPVCLQMILLMF